MSDWKPGDVAMIGWNMTSGMERAIRQPSAWETESGIRVQDVQVTEARPLVVIDPESAEDVKRLGDLLAPYAITRPLAAALREYAAPTPPRPDEPQGLGAVVEDANGDLFVRWSTRHREDRNWKHNDNQGGDYRSWDNVNVVRVLSEGVTP